MGNISATFHIKIHMYFEIIFIKYVFLLQVH